MARNEIWDELSPKSKEKIFALIEFWTENDEDILALNILRFNVIYEIFGEEAFSNRLHNLHRELAKSNTQICETLKLCIQDARGDTPTSEGEQCSTEGDPKVPKV